MGRLVAFVFTCLLAGVFPIFAQEAGSRSEEEARQQQEKARKLSHSNRNFLERALLGAEQAGGFGVPHGFFVAFGDIKRGSGIALGPAYGRVLSSGTRVVGKGVYSINDYKLAQLSAVTAPLFADRLVISGRARWQDAPTVRLYALGPDSPNVRTEYAETKTEASGNALFSPFRPLQFGGGVGFEAFSTGSAHSADPRLGLFAVPGMGADPTYLHTKGSVAVDWRDSPGYSRHGTLLRGTVHDYRDQDTGLYTFQRIDGDAEQYVPILHGNWVIFLALHASTTSTSAGHDVPFFLMPDLGGEDLRGFANYRFRDRHSIYVTAEYRWYAQEFLDGVIFYDAGKVVPDRSSLDFSNLRNSFGAGLRLHGPQNTAVRLEVAHSSEGMRVILGFSPRGR
jgi:hypothetical protein